MPGEAGGAANWEDTVCRSIKTLRRTGEPPTADEIDAAALQFVRKISGYRRPSAANKQAFDAAVAEVAESSSRLLASFRTGTKSA